MIGDIQQFGVQWRDGACGYGRGLDGLISRRIGKMSSLDLAASSRLI